MLLQVGIDDDKAIPNDKNWLYQHPKDALIFSKTSLVWNVLKKVYVTSFKELVTDKFPDENTVFQTLIFLSERIKGIEWDIKK